MHFRPNLSSNTHCYLDHAPLRKDLRLKYIRWLQRSFETELSDLRISRLARVMTRIRTLDAQYKAQTGHRP